MPASLLTVTPLTARGISDVGFLPSQFAGLAAWYDAAQITGISSGASLSAWTDVSGQNVHASQSLATLQPQFVVNAVNGNGNAVRFLNGSGEYLRTSSFSANVVQPSTYWFACSLNSAAGVNSNFIVDGGASAASRNAVFDNAAGEQWAYYAGTVVNSGVSVSFGTTAIITAIFAGSNSSLFLNGSLLTRGNPGTQSVVSLTIGNSFGVIVDSETAGDICELGLYTRALTQNELNQLHTYLGAKWGRSVVLA